MTGYNSLIMTKHY